MKRPALPILAIGLLLILLVGATALDRRLEDRARYLANLAAEQAKVRRVTIREGLTRQEIAELLAKQGIVSQEEFLAATAADEGRLFPDTYQLKQGMAVTDLRQKLLDNFLTRTKELNPTRDQLILASIIEREAKGDADRGQIAGVYQNRLKIGMKLEADPTVQYAKFTDLSGAKTNSDGTKTYWAEITRADYQAVNSPYNTYLYPGLPPGPICNPGKKAIAAAVNPTPTEAYFFFHTRSGQAVFSKTLEEHQRKLADR